MGMLEARIPPPLLVLGIGAAMATIMLAEPPQLSIAIRAAVAALFLLGAGLFGAPAFSAFGRAKTTINPVQIDRATSLVTTGIYRVTRNPMYLALALVLCAWAAWLARPLAALGPVCFVLFITRFQIIPEERALLAGFGAAYADYRRSVRRWL